MTSKVASLVPSLLFAGVVSVAPFAQAVTVSNTDEEPHTIEVVIEDTVEKISLIGGEVREGLCPDGCTITMGEQTVDDLAGEETVVIRDGVLSVQG